MSFDDLKRGLLPIGSGGKILQAIQTAAVIGLGGWMASTVSSDHYAISSMASDINHLVTTVRDDHQTTDNEIGRLVNIQEDQEREIARLQQAMSDRLKADFPPH